MPQDVKCHEMYHVAGDPSILGIWLSTNKFMTIAYVCNNPQDMYCHVCASMKRVHYMTPVSMVYMQIYNRDAL